MLELHRWLVGLLGHFSGSVVVLQLDLVRGCMCNKGMYHIEVLLLWTVHILLTGADDPCLYTYCGGGTCNSVTGVCDCPDGREGRYCQYQKGGEACTHQTLPLHPLFPSLETFSSTYL